MAAGFGRRFGADKRLHLLPRSFDLELPKNAPLRTVAETTVAKYSNVFDNVRVVVRPEDDELRLKLDALDVDVVTAPQAHLGMGYSLAAGFAALDSTWAFVALADMPFIKTETLRLLYNTAQSNTRVGILRPSLSLDENTRDEDPREATNRSQAKTHPVGWHQHYFRALRLCKGDTGARTLLQTHAAQVRRVSVDDAGIQRDIDHLSDLKD